ncbi:MAG: transcriptional repressor [Anaerolineae bacterium]|nr:transcriptional repressor [Anaerolineae bacterium]
MMPELDELVTQLRAAGYRITPQRRIVLEALLDQRGTHLHLSLDDIMQALEARDVHLDPVTVYRILQWLKDEHLIAQTDLGAGHDVYSWIGERPHHHLICLNCGREIIVDDSLFTPLREALLKDYHFEARIEHFAIFGLCADCAEDQHTAPR